MTMEYLNKIKVVVYIALLSVFFTLMGCGSDSTDELYSSATGLDLYNTVNLDFSHYENVNFEILMEDIVVNGASSSVRFKYPPAMGTLWLYVENNDELIAEKIELLAITSIFDTRLKLKQSTNVVAIFKNPGGTIYAARKSVEVTNGSVPAECPPPNCVVPSEIGTIQMQANIDRLQILIGSNMDYADHITYIEIFKNDVPVANITATPYVNRSAYFALTMASTIGNTIELVVHATNDRMSTVSGVVE